MDKKDIASPRLPLPGVLLDLVSGLGHDNVAGHSRYTAYDIITSLEP